MNRVIYLGGGCFWCIESVFKKVKGITSILPGYMGGDNPNPTYEEVCEGYTNHVEVVKIEYDDSIDISQILSIFFVVHDPTSINRQGADVGSQYRSAIFCNAEERSLIVDYIQFLEMENIFEDKIVTQVNNIEIFILLKNIIMITLQKTLKMLIVKQLLIQNLQN
jgi:peptide-methionine (S)-S-oxide reductase